MFGVFMLLQLQVQQQVFVMVNGDRDGVVEFSGLSREWICINRCVKTVLLTPRFYLNIHCVHILALTQLPEMPLFAFCCFFHETTALTLPTITFSFFSQ